MIFNLEPEAVAEREGSWLHHSCADKSALEIIKCGLIGEVGGLSCDFPSRSFGRPVTVACNQIRDRAGPHSSGSPAQIHVGEQVGVVRT